MPRLLYITVQAESPPEIAPIHLPALFRSFLTAGEDAQDERTAHVPLPRPYALSTFRRSDSGWMWRAALLDDGLWPALERGLHRQNGREWGDQGIEIDVEQVSTEQISYERLREEAVAETRLPLRFVSPTSASGRLASYPLPDPVVLYRSWLLRWNRFSPQKLDRVLLDVAAVHVAVSYCRIHTRAMDLGVGREIGFVGRVTLRVLQPHKLGPRVVADLYALACFSAFCGTGHRTAQGMGQTRFLAGPQEAS